MKLPEFSVNRKVTVAMLTILVVILGIVTFRQLGLEMMPDLDYPIVTIVTVYPGASSEDIEETVTKPIESGIASVKDIKTLKSESKENFSILSVEFEWGTNLDFAAQDIRAAIDIISDQLPDDAEKPMVLKIDFSQMPVLMYTVVGAENTYKLRKIIEDDVEPALKHLDGVASLMIMGGKEAEKQIIVDRITRKNKKLKINVQRFKGLGEMNPMQLRETTMARDTRRLVRLTIDSGTDGDQADDSKTETFNMLDMLLSKKRAGDRRTWLEDKGNLVRDVVTL